MKRVVVGRVRDIAPGERKIVDVGGRSIGVFRVGDSFYALRNRCPHQGGPLCQGRLLPWMTSHEPGKVGVDHSRTLLACPWHGWEYELATGQSWLGPGEGRVRSYDVSVEPAGDREPGPYVAETYPIHVEDDYVVLEA